VRKKEKWFDPLVREPMLLKACGGREEVFFVWKAPRVSQRGTGRRKNHQKMTVTGVHLSRNAFRLLLGEKARDERSIMSKGRRWHGRTEFKLDNWLRNLWIAHSQGKIPFPIAGGLRLMGAGGDLINQERRKEQESRTR